MDDPFTLLMITCGIVFIAVMGLGVVGGLDVIGLDTGSGEQIGYISEVERNGIFWKPAEIRLINIEPTFSSQDTSWYYGSDSDENTQKAIQCMKNHDEVIVKYKTYQVVAPWDYSHRTLVTDIIVVREK